MEPVTYGDAREAEEKLLEWQSPGGRGRRVAENVDVNYRDQALKLFPHVCARCAREFQGKRLQELTVHHKDGNHDNNPPDGSNWELLCVYCHENEHARYEDSRAGGPWQPASQDRDLTPLHPRHTAPLPASTRC